VDRDTIRRVFSYVRQNGLRAFGIVAAGLAMLALLLEPYVRVNRGFHRYYADCVLPEPRSWLAAPPDSVWGEWTGTFRAGLQFEQWLFCGVAFFGLLAVAGAFVLLKRPATEDRVLVRAALVAAVVLVLLTVRLPGGGSAWRLVFRFAPGANGVRAVTRVFTAVHLFGLVAGTVAADRLLRRLQVRWASIVAAGLLVLAAGEQIQWRLRSFDHDSFFRRVAVVQSGLAGADAAYVELDPGRPYWEAQLVAMWAGLRADVPVVNGYSGRWPPGYPAWDRTLTEAELRGWLSGRWRGRLTVVGPDGGVKYVLTID
jgi:hypothetical protein